jgi:hypothetical protein
VKPMQIVKIQKFVSRTEEDLESVWTAVVKFNADQILSVLLMIIGQHVSALKDSRVIQST